MTEQSLGRLSIKLTADLKSLIAGVREATELLDKFRTRQQASFQNFEQAFSRLDKGVSGKLSGNIRELTKAITGLQKQMSNSASIADPLIKALSQVDGATQNTLKGWKKWQKTLYDGFGGIAGSGKAAGGSVVWGLENLGRTIREDGIKAAKSIQEGLAPLGVQAKRAKQITNGIAEVFAGANKLATAASKRGVIGTSATRLVDKQALEELDLEKRAASLQRPQKQASGFFQRALSEAGMGGGAGGGIRGFFKSIADDMLNVIALQTRWLAGFQLINVVTDAFKSGVTAVVDFNDALYKLAAISKASDSELVLLANAARNIATHTTVSAVEAASALTTLAQTGLNVRESIQALQAVTALAVGGVSTLEAATQLLTTALRAFNVDASRSDEVANLLVATVNTTKTTIDGLNTSFSYSAATAAEAGLSLKDYLAALGTLADQGVAAATQGTAVRQLMGALLKPTEALRRVLQELGISLADINPLTSDFGTILRRLHDAGFSAAEAFQVVERRTAGAVVELVRGAEHFAYIRDTIGGTDAAYAALARRQESFSANLKILGNQLRVFVERLNSDFLPTATVVIQGFQGIVEQLINFRGALVGLGAAVPVLLLVKKELGVMASLQVAFGDLLPVSALLTLRFQELYASLLSLGARLSWLAGPYGIILAAVAAVGYEYTKAKDRQEAYSKSLGDLSERVSSSVANARMLGDSYTVLLSKLSRLSVGTSAYAAASEDLKQTVFDILLRFPDLLKEYDHATQRFSMAPALLKQRLEQSALDQTLGDRRAELEKQAAKNRSYTDISGYKNYVEAIAGLKDLEKIALESKTVAVQTSQAFAELLAQEPALKDLLRNGAPELAAQGTAHLVQSFGALGAQAAKLSVPGEKLNAFLAAWSENAIHGQLNTKVLEDTLGSVFTEEQRSALAKYIEESNRLPTTLHDMAAQMQQVDADLLKFTEDALRQTGLIRAKIDQEQARSEALARGLAAGLSPIEIQLLEEKARVAIAQVDAELQARQDTLEKYAKEHGADSWATLAEDAKRSAGTVVEAFQAALEKSSATITLESSRRTNQIREEAARAADQAQKSLDKATEDYVQKQLESQGRFIEAENERFRIQKLHLDGEFAGVEQITDATTRQVKEKEYATRLSELQAQHQVQLIAEQAKLTKEQTRELEAQTREIVNQAKVQQEQLAVALRNQQLAAATTQSQLDLQGERLTAGANPFVGKAQEEAAIAESKLRAAIHANTEEIESRKTAIEHLTQKQADLRAQGTDSANSEIRSLQKQIDTYESENRQAELQNDNLSAKIPLIKKAGEAVFETGGLAKQAIAGALDGLFSGSKKLSDVGKSVWKSFVGQAKDAFAQTIVEKLGLDRVFKTNFLDLGAHAGKSLFDGISGGLSSAEGGLLSWVSRAKDAFAGMFQGAAETPPGGGAIATETPTAPITTPTTEVTTTTAEAGKATASAAGSVAGQTAGQWLAALTAVIAAVKTVIGTVQAISKQAKSLDKITQHDPHTASNFKLASNISLGINTAAGVGMGAAAGAAAGAPVFGVGAIFGAVIGAAIGAIVGATLSKILSSVVSGQMTKGISTALKQGLSQKELAASVEGAPKIRMIRGLFGFNSGVADAVFGGSQNNPLSTRTIHGKAFASLFDPVGLVFNQLLDMMMTMPSIEKIFDKLFVKVFRQAGVSLDTHMQSFLGEGLPKKLAETAKTLFGKAGTLTQETRILARFVSTLIGAGRDSWDRVQRFYLMVANGLTGQGKTIEKIRGLLYSSVRLLTGGDLVSAVGMFERVFAPALPKRIQPVADAMERVAAAGKKVSATTAGDFKTFRTAVTKLIAPAYAKVLPGADVPGIVELLIEGNYPKVGAKSVKKSRAAIKEAIPSLFETTDFEKNFTAFHTKLSEGVKSAVVAGFTKALLHTVLGNALSVVFAKISKVVQTASGQGGISETRQEKLQKRIANAGTKAGQILEKLHGFLAGVSQTVTDALDGLDTAMQTEDQLHKQRLGYVNQIQQAIESFLLSVNDTLRRQIDMAVRLSQKIFTAQGTRATVESGALSYTDPGTDPRATGYLSYSAKQQQRFFRENSGVLSSDARIKVLEGLESTVDTWLSTSVNLVKEQFDPIIQIAQKAKQLFDQAKSVMDSLRVDARSPLNIRDRLDSIEKDILVKQKTLQTGSPEDQIAAGTDLVALLQQRLQLAAEAFDPAGPQFRGLFLQTLKDLGDLQQRAADGQFDLEDIAREINAKLGPIESQAAEYYQWIKKNSAEAYQQEQKDLDSRQRDLFRALGVGPGKPLTLILAGLLGKSPRELAGILDSVTSAITDNPGIFTEGAPRGRSDATDTAQRLVGYLHDLITSAPTAIVQKTSSFLSGLQQLLFSLDALHLGNTPIAQQLVALYQAATAPGAKTTLQDFDALLQTLSGSLPKAAKGGIVTKRQIIEVGEGNRGGGNRAEAIIPLEDSRAMLYLASGMLSAIAKTRGAQGTAAFALQATAQTTREATTRSAVQYQAGTTALHVQPGAIVFNVHDADRTLVEALPQRTVDALVRQIQHGKLGRVIEERARR